MLSAFRKFLSTRAARVFFILLIVPFVLWGVADVARNFGGNDALATVGNARIEPAAFQDAFRRQVAAVQQRMGTAAELSPADRRLIAAQTLDALVTEAAVNEEVRRLGIVVPDEALRRAVFDIPAFRGPTGSFDRPTFNSRLRQIGLTEQRFLDLVRGELARGQLLEAVQVGAGVPEEMVKPLYAYARETRGAEMVELPFSAAPAPPPPTDAQLEAAYKDDPNRYRAPATRHIKAVFLTPETVARGIDVSDADIQTFFDAHRAEFGTPERRSLQVIVAPDEATARRLGAEWAAGADWVTMEKAAAAANSSSVALDDATRDTIPAPELAAGAFAAAPDAVVGPVASALGFQLFRVTKVTPGSEQALAEVRDAIRDRLARERAADGFDARVNKLEDVLASGASFDEIPADLGAAAMGGTLDRTGNGPDGEPAPIPGQPAFRAAVLSAAFALPLNDPPRLTQGPGNGWYGITVDAETAAAPRPFDEVKDQVRENWDADARRRAQETVAARLLAAVKAGGSLDDAATVAGLRVERTPMVGRPGPDAPPVEGVPSALRQALFAMKDGEATMVQDRDGFLVARLAAVEAPDPAADPAAAGQLRAALAASIRQDTALAYEMALRERARPTVNRTMLEQFTQ